MTTHPRIGFCCKYVQPHEKRLFESVDGYNTGATTVAWLNRQSRDVAEEKLWDIMVRNLEATQRLVDYVGEQNANLKMVRLSSDILPMFTEPTWSYFWRRDDVVEYCQRNFGIVGDSARRSNTRLSFHPGQFCVLASASPEIVQRSIEEFEYHATMARWMGYGKKFQDFKINVHISGRQGPEGIRLAYKKLSPEARNTITIENEEITHGLDDCLSISDLVPIVLDIHHHWIREGVYIDPTSDSVKRVVDSWRGVRPAMHYSVSREDLLVGHCANTLPDMPSLLAQGFKKQQLRAHSDFCWNTAVNDWALTFTDKFDIQVEAKAKNLASKQLYEQYINRNS